MQKQKEPDLEPKVENPDQNIRKNSSQDNQSPSKSSSSPYHSSNSSRSRSKSPFSGDEERDNKIVRYKYCCKICKHPDKSKKACVCVVPLSQRRADLGGGCRNCGCLGCSKEDYIKKGEDPEFHPDQYVKNENKKFEKNENQKREQKRDFKRGKSPVRKPNKSPPRRRKHSNSPQTPEYIDPISMKFHNFDRSMLGSMISNEYQVNPILLGFGIPQRTHSYVFGRPK